LGHGCLLIKTSGLLRSERWVIAVAVVVVATGGGCSRSTKKVKVVRQKKTIVATVTLTRGEAKGISAVLLRMMR